MTKLTKTLPYILLIFSFAIMLFLAVTGSSGTQLQYFRWVFFLVLNFSLSVFALLNILVGYRKSYMVSTSIFLILIEVGVYLIYIRYGSYPVNPILIVPIIASIGYLIGNGCQFKYSQYTLIVGTVLYLVMIGFVMMNYSVGFGVESIITALYIYFGQTLFGLYSYLKRG